MEEKRSNVGVKTSVFIDGVEKDAFFQQPPEGNGGEFGKTFMYKNDDGDFVELIYHTTWRQRNLSEMPVPKLVDWSPTYNSKKEVSR